MEVDRSKAAFDFEKSRAAFEQALKDGVCRVCGEPWTGNGHKAVCKGPKQARVRGTETSETPGGKGKGKAPEATGAPAATGTAGTVRRRAPSNPPNTHQLFADFLKKYQKAADSGDEAYYTAYEQSSSDSVSPVMPGGSDF